ncbi:retrotransposable element Tf2 [Tanacetum coccineum]
MKSLADKHKSDREFEEGVWVYLKLQPYRQATLRQGKQHKLSPKYFGPFLIMKKVGKVAYKLQLPSSSQIYPVFHDRKMAKKGNTVVYVLIQWVNGTAANATWETYRALQKDFHTLT